MPVTASQASRILDWSVGTVWLVGAGTLMRDGRHGLIAAMLVRLNVPPAAGTFATAGAAGVEVFLGATLLLGASVIDRVASATVLCVLAMVLAVRGMQYGWSTDCGCLDVLVSESVATGICRNVVLALAMAASIVLRRTRVRTVHQQGPHEGRGSVGSK